MAFRCLDPSGAIKTRATAEAGTKKFKFEHVLACRFPSRARYTFHLPKNLRRGETRDLVHFPWWWGPWWGWNWGYYPYGPYEYSEYSYPSYYSGYGYGYGNYGYGYGYANPSGTYYGSYYSATNYENDDESVVRNVLAEYTVSWNRHDTAAVGRLFTEDCDYVNIAGVHWKGVQEIVRRQAELFQNRLKKAVRRLTGAEVRFSTPDVALVHATWDVTGWNRPTGEAVPVLKEITTMTMVKTDGKWLITAFQDTESGGSTK